MIWDQLIEISQKFLVYLDSETDVDAQIVAYDRFLNEREPLIQIISESKMIEDQGRIDKLYALDIKIKKSLESSMKDTKKSIDEIKAQREAMVKVKRSSGGYSRQTASSEGYFFDKKK